MSCFTCLWSFVLLLFMLSRTGHTYLCVETIANAVWLVNSHLDIFVPFFLWVVLIHIHDVCVYRLLVAIVMASRAGFRRVPRTTQGYVTLCCGLLVVARSLRLVILFFEECLELHGGVLLFVVGCLLLCDRYVWSYCFSKNDSNFMGMCYSLL